MGLGVDILGMAERKKDDNLDFLADVILPDEKGERGVFIISGANPKDFKIKLAKEIVKLCHSAEASDRAEENWNKTFSEGGVPDDVLTLTVAQDALMVDILLAEKIIDSKTDWRRLVENGAVTNMQSGEKITDDKTKAISGTYRIGKKRFVKIIN